MKNHPIENINYIQEFLRQAKKLKELGLITGFDNPEALWAALALCERNQIMAGTWSTRKRQSIEKYLVNLFPDFRND